MIDKSRMEEKQFYVHFENFCSNDFSDYNDLWIGQIVHQTVIITFFFKSLVLWNVLSVSFSSNGREEQFYYCTESTMNCTSRYGRVKDWYSHGEESMEKFHIWISDCVRPICWTYLIFRTHASGCWLIQRFFWPVLEWF